MSRSVGRVAAYAAAVLLAAPAGASAQSGAELADSDRGPAATDDRVYHGAEGELAVHPPRLDDPSVDVDGSLDEPAWQRAAVLRGFTQFEPNEGLPATEATEVLVLVAPDAIYFGVRADDSRMGEIRATLAERDGFTRNDDFVRFVLDTFDDQRKAYVFSVNPYGVQHDGLWVVGGGGERRGFGPPIDDNPDFVWESDARMHEDGWTAELKIPFKSLRFPDRPLQDWGFNVTRTIQRRGFQQSWAPLSSNAANQLSQSGRLVGLRDLDPGFFLEINPVATGKRVGEYDDETDGLVHGGFEDEYGVNVTYGLTSNLTLDATINPDFSQVEADAGQIVVNERFPVFFPEKRPFFLEGTEIFSLPANLIYTRSIADPIAGAKLTGKVGSLNVGYLGAVDQFAEGSDAVVNIVRARQDVGGSSTVGLLYTDRTRTGEDYNRVAGADARFVLGSRYTLTLLGAASRTAGPGEDEGDASGTPDPEVGTYLLAGIERAGRELTFRTQVEDAAADFHAGSGFLRRTGDTEVSGEIRVSRYGAPDAFVETVSPNVQFRGFWNHDDFWAGERLKEGQFEVGNRISFRNNITLFANYTRGLFDYDAAAYEGLWVVPEDGTPRPFRPDQSLFGGLDGARIFLFFNPWEKVRGNVRVNWEEGPIFDRGLGVPVEPGQSWGGELSLSFFPTPHLQGELAVRHSRIERERDGSRYSTATIPRLRAQYQFSRALFLRTIFEYSAQEREAPRDPVTGARLAVDCETACKLRGGSDANDFHVEGLLGYEPTPGTVFFLGYTRDMEEPEPFGFRDLEPRADGFFVKVSYRFRL